MTRAFLLRALFLFALVSVHFSLRAQNLEEDTVRRDSTIVQVTKPHAAFIELGGPGLALTANYDTRFGNHRDKWGFRIGAGYYNTGANWVATVPFQVNYLYGKKDSFFEIGFGTTFVRSEGSTNGTVFEFDNITGFIGTATFGYRYQQEHGGINFRINFVPILYDDGLTAAGGVSVGYTF